MLYDTDCFAWGLGMIRVDNIDNEGTQLITDVRNGNADFINVDTGFGNADNLFTNWTSQMTSCLHMSCTSRRYA